MSRALVIDCSIVGPIVFADEPALSEHTANAIVRGPLIVPAHWPLEIMNMLHFGERRGRINRAGRHAAVREIRDLAAAVQTDTGEFAWVETSRLADQYRLTLYDAAYLELATRLHASIATRDDELIEAARVEGLDVLT